MPNFGAQFTTPYAHDTRPCGDPRPNRFFGVIGIPERALRVET